MNIWEKALIAAFITYIVFEVSFLLILPGYNKTLLSSWAWPLVRSSMPDNFQRLTQKRLPK